MILKWSLRLSAFVALSAIVLLIASLYLPQTSEFGKHVVNLLGGDKVIHVLVGALLPLLLAFLALLFRASKRLQWCYWLACLMLFGIDEILQSFSPLRSSDIGDLAMSALGWVIGCSLWWLIWLLRQGKQQN